MSIIIPVANQKGGCGKTTTVMNLASGLAGVPYRVLVVDADPQGSALLWSAAAARRQRSLPFDVTAAWQLKGGAKFSSLLQLDYEIILVDCPPGIADLESRDAAARFAREAMRGADGILVPLRPSTLDFSAASSFVQLLQREKPADVKTAVLLNCLKSTRIGKQAPGVAAALFAPIAGAVVLQSTIGDRAPIVEVCNSGETIFEFAPNSTAATEYRNLTKEILQWLTNTHPSKLTASLSSTSPSAQPATVQSL